MLSININSMVQRKQSRDEHDDSNDQKVDNSKRRSNSRGGDESGDLKKRDAPASRNRKRSESSDDNDDRKNKKGGKQAKFDSSDEESHSRSDSRSQKSDDSDRKGKKKFNSNDRDNSNNRNQKPGYDNESYEVYFGDVSFNAVEDDIRQYFQNCGQILQVKLLTREDGKSRGRGFIKFSDEKAMKNALKLNGTELMGRRIVVEQPTNKSNARAPGFGGRDNNNQESSSIIVRNLPFNFVDDDLQQMFESYGSIKSFRVIKNENGQSKGFGFVDFENSGDASAALVKSGSEINGRRITVDFSLPKGDRPFNSGGRGGFGGSRGGRGGGFGGRPHRGYRNDD